jgi:hypothetical protein
MTYPNRAQWLSLWVALLLLAWALAPFVFSLNWWVQPQFYGRYAWRLFAILPLAAALLFWQASRWSRVRQSRVRARDI